MTGERGAEISPSRRDTKLALICALNYKLGEVQSTGSRLLMAAKERHESEEYQRG